MQVFRCPDCQLPLAHVHFGGPRGYVCRSCGGHLLTFGQLLGNATAERVQTFLRAVRRRGRVGLACPSCGRPMSSHELNTDPYAPLTLQTCAHCRLGWIDPITRRSAAEARVRARMKTRNKRGGTQDSTPDDDAEPTPPDPSITWRRAQRWFGFKADDGQARPPMLTWNMTVMLFLAGLWSLWDHQNWVQDLGLIAGDPWRLGGVTLLTYAFIPPNPLALALDLWALLVITDNVESLLGRRRASIVLLMGAIGGGLSHALFASPGEPPALGASAALTSMALLYALRFPAARMSLLVGPFAHLHNRGRVPAAVAVGLWLAVQPLVSWSGVAASGRTSGWTHVGAAAVGAIAWAIWGRRASRHAR